MAAKRENLLLNITCNIAIPSLILSFLSKEDRLGPVWGLIIAILFPVCYGIWDFFDRRQANFISILGFCSILLTGGLGLLKVGGLGFAIKDAAIPLLIGAMIVITQRGKRPLVRELLYNDQAIDVPRIDAALDSTGSRPAFDALMARSAYLLALGFIVSAGLNFGLARYLLRSTPGTPEFNNELGRMHALSWPIIIVPSMLITFYSLYLLIKGVQKLTGLTLDDILRPPEPKPAKD